jgi:hypothetical protein
MVVVLIALPLAIFWTWQFVQLMLLEDRFFPGRFDKLLWGAAFVLVVPLAPFAFRAWKFARTAERASASPTSGSPI